MTRFIGEMTARQQGIDINKIFILLEDIEDDDGDEYKEGDEVELKLYFDQRHMDNIEPVFKRTIDGWEAKVMWGSLRYKDEETNQEPENIMNKIIKYARR